MSNSLSWIRAWAPWLLLVPMLDVCVFPFIAPYEEPRWLLFVTLAVVLWLIAAYEQWRKPLRQRRYALHHYGVAFFLTVLAFGILYTPNPLEGVLRWSFWLSAFTVLYASVWSARHHSHYARTLPWMLSFAALFFSLHYWWQYMPGRQHVDYASMAPGGEQIVFFSPIGHVNFTGDALILLIPMLGYVLWQYRREPAWLLLNSVSFISLVAILLIGSSRGAVGGLIAGGMLATAVVLLPRLYRSTRLWPWWQRVLPILVLPLVLMIVLMYAKQYHPPLTPQTHQEASSVHRVFDLSRLWSSLRYAWSVQQEPLRHDVRQPPLAELWWQLQPVIAPERAALYASATAMLADAPWLGHGTGSFSFIFPAYSNYYPQFRDSLSTMHVMASNPHNVFFQIACQNGVTTALLFLAMLFFLWWRIVRALYVRQTMHLYAACMAITAALFDSMFNHVFFNPASLYCFALFAGVWWVWSESGSTYAATEAEPVYHSSRVRSRLLPVVIVLACVAVSFCTFRWGASQWYLGHTLLHGDRAYAMEYYRTAYRMNPYNFRAVMSLAEQSYVDKDYAQSMAFLEWLVRISPYNAVALNNLAALHIQYGDAQRSVELLQRALRVQPDFELAQKTLASLTVEGR